jgi:putative ABC transport system substrate-binding protein
MNRREFITVLGGSAAAWPITVRAQQQRTPVIGWLSIGTRSDDARWSRGFHQGLMEAGYVEGRNVAIEYRWAEDQNDRLPALTAELIQRRVQVIVASSNLNSLAAAKAATTSIPIVFMSGPDPVRAGLVAGLNRPGGNVTGVFLLTSELTAKRLGLLHDVVPQLSMIAMLLDGRAGASPTGNQESNLTEAEAAGRKLGLRVIGVRVRGEGDFDGLLASARGEGAGAVLVSSSIFLINHREQVVAAAAKHGLPAIYQSREYPEAGGLMSYGADATEGFRQAGIYTGRILKGAKPADLPIVQPAKFELIINLKAAKALGLEIPSGVSAIADEVIE